MKPESMDKLFHALASEPRRKMLDILRDKPGSSVEDNSVSNGGNMRSGHVGSVEGLARQGKRVRAAAEAARLQIGTSKATARPDPAAGPRGLTWRPGALKFDGGEGVWPLCIPYIDSSYSSLY